MRRGFGLPQAIMIILFIGSLVLIGMKYSRVGVNHYADTYIAEQAKLLMHSSKEWALWQISGTDRSGGGCWAGGTISRTSGHFSFNITVEAEHYYRSDGITCNNVDTIAIEAPESNGMVALKITIQDSEDKIKIINRSIQRP